MNRPKHVGTIDPATMTIAAAFISYFGVLPSLSAATLVFQQGVSGYAGTLDTFLAQGDPTTIKGALTAAEWDHDDPPGTGLSNYALIRFNALFDTNGGPIPAGSTITSATLTYTIFNVGDEGVLREAFVDWNESTTYNNFGGAGSPGVQPQEYGGIQATASASVTTHNLNVTGSLATWSTNPSLNRGWIVLPTGTNGAEFYSSESATVSLRPRLTVVINEGPPVVQLVRHPYLQSGSSDSMTIVWRTDSATDTRLRYGSSPANLQQSISNATAVTDHVVTITGLEPHTKYFYDIGTTTQVLGGGDANHYFVTAPSAGTRTRFTSWIVGDSGTGDANQAAVRDAMLSETGPHPPDIYLHLGDMAYESGTDSEFSTNFYAAYQNILRNTVCWPTIGNHNASSATASTS